MSLSERENETLTDWLQALEPELKQLKPHERSFIEDQISRHEEYGANIRVSAKQWNWLRVLYERVTGDKTEGNVDGDPRFDNRDADFRHPDDDIPF